MTNMFVLYEIGLKFQSRLAPYPLGQCRIECTAHIYITGSNQPLPLFPSAPPFQPDLSRWKGIEVSNYNRGVLAKIGITSSTFSMAVQMNVCGDRELSLRQAPLGPDLVIHIILVSI